MELPMPVKSSLISFGSKPQSDQDMDGQSQSREPGVISSGEVAEPPASIPKDVHQAQLNKSLQAAFRLIAAQEIGGVTTKLTSDTEWSGVYVSKQCNAGLAVAGFISGEVTLGDASLFFLEPTGRAEKCTVRADAVLITGNFSGVINAKKLEIAGGATVDGKIYYEEVAIHPGAKVKAEHHMPE